MSFSRALLRNRQLIYKYHEFQSIVPSISRFCHYRYYNYYYHQHHRYSYRNNLYCFNKVNNCYYHYRYHIHTDNQLNDKNKDNNNNNSNILKYLNPIFIGKKIWNIIYNICYYTVDSIIHPKVGYERLKTIYKKTKQFIKHFIESSKLMWTDIKTARKILIKFRRGNELTYRERRQLRRVTLDILKFVPMLVIMAIPFLEAALPFLLYIFPNMLPSRFQSEHNKLEQRKKLLQARIGLAAFFEDTLHEFVKETKTKEENNKSINSLENLLIKIKNNEEITNPQILKVAALFDDEMALDNASYSVLSNMCRYMQLNSFGTEAMLRSRLYDKIRVIRKEDAVKFV